MAGGREAGAAVLKDALILSGLRSPRARARRDGALHELTPQALLAQLYAGIESRAAIDPADVDEVILGCVTQHGEQAGNIARSSLLYAGWPARVPGMTVNRYCSSSIDALALGAMKINVGAASLLLAGGVEMMSRVPMLADQARVFQDAEFGRACRILLMGSGADLVASLHGVSREEADAVALASQQRAARAREAGYLDRSLLPIETSAGPAARDECIREGTTADSLAAMPAVFAEIGASGVDRYQLDACPALDAVTHIHSAGNSPAMADAAAVMLLGDRECAARLALEPRARIVASTTVGDDPLQVLTGCISATEALLERTGLAAADVDLFEVHEAFAATAVLAQRRLHLDGERLNVNGGCIALGHPMGATGAIMALTLLDELERRDLRRGIVAAAGAAGSGSALLIDRHCDD